MATSFQIDLKHLNTLLKKRYKTAEQTRLIKPRRISALSVYKMALHAALFLLIGAPLLTHAEGFQYRYSEHPLAAIEKPEFPTRISSFVNSAHRSGIAIEIEDCESMYYMAGGENTSHVASCKLKNGVFPVLLCDSSMTNSFAISVTFAKSPNGMADFLYKHCYGG